MIPRPPRSTLPTHACPTRRSSDLMHLFDVGYAGLLLQEDGAANLCLSVARDRLSDGVPAMMRAIMAQAPHLAERMGGKMPPSFDAIADRKSTRLNSSH